MSETRSILDKDGNVVGELTMPDNTSEDIWSAKLGEYSYVKPSVPIEEQIKAKILGAMEFGKNIMAEYGASNVLAGLSLSQVQQVMTSTAKIQSALLSGSLYVALDEISKLELDDVIITDARVTAFRNKIQKYLNIPLT